MHLPGQRLEGCSREKVALEVRRILGVVAGIGLEVDSSPVLEALVEGHHIDQVVVAGTVPEADIVPAEDTVLVGDTGLGEEIVLEEGVGPVEGDTAALAEGIVLAGDAVPGEEDNNPVAGEHRKVVDLVAALVLGGRTAAGRAAVGGLLSSKQRS